MINIRSNCFETNSSSVHAICLYTTNKYELPDSGVEFTLNEFGWENEIYRTTYMKAAYLYTAIAELEEPERTNMLSKVIKALDSKNIKYNFEYIKEDSYDFYIDHRGELGSFFNQVVSNEETLLSFLFNEDNFIVTSNDNNGWDISDIISDCGNLEAVIWKGN